MEKEMKMTVNGSLEGKVAVVTGGSQGIGFAISRVFLLQGAKVLMVGRNQNALLKVQEKLKQDYPKECENCFCFSGDVSMSGIGNLIMEVVVERWGGVDILVNNVGGIKLLEVDQGNSKDCREAIELNLISAVECTHSLIPVLKKRGGGSIVNICSVSAHRGNPSTGFYPVAKAALRSYTMCLAAKLAPDHIRVNSISPGPVDTTVWEKLAGDKAELWKQTIAQRIPMGRLGLADEVARTALFLVDSGSSWITGIDMVIDGGMLAS